MTDRELVGADRCLARPKGRIQAVGPRTGPGRRARAPASPRAIGPAHRRAASSSSSIASTGAFPVRPLAGPVIAPEPGRRPPRSAPRRLRLRAPQSPIRRPGSKASNWRHRGHLHSAQRDQRRHAGRPGAGRGRPAQSRWPHAGPHSFASSSAATPPSSAPFTMPAPIASATTSSSPSTSA